MDMGIMCRSVAMDSLGLQFVCSVFGVTSTCRVLRQVKKPLSIFCTIGGLDREVDCICSAIFFQRGCGGERENIYWGDAQNFFRLRLVFCH